MAKHLQNVAFIISSIENQTGPTHKLKRISKYMYSKFELAQNKVLKGLHCLHKLKIILAHCKQT